MFMLLNALSMMLPHQDLD